MLTFCEILSRLKTKTGYKNDLQIASLFGVKPAILSGWKKRNTINIIEIVDICKKHNINLHWLLTGEGDPESRPVPRVAESLSQYCSRRDFDNDFVKVLEQLEGDVKKQVRAITLLEIFVTKKFKESEVAVLVGDRSAVHEHDP